MIEMKKTFLKSIFLFFGLLASLVKVLAQVPQVPSVIQFADISLRINEQARREIQLDVDALHRNSTYFRQKLDRARLYMPLVEREFQEVGVPLDLKYLVLQESSLIADAVSTSNAVGFWQFKQGTAEEVFLRVDGQVDERKNIVSSSRGAAMYLKKHNNQFDNWMCALVSYQMGLGGARAYFGTQLNGKKVLDIDRNTHWYFKKYLAHKVAFEGYLNTFVNNIGVLEEVRVQGPTTFKALAPRLGVSEEHLREYNKWAPRGNIPEDKPYSIVFLGQGGFTGNTATPVRRESVATTASSSSSQTQTSPSTGYPKVTGNQQNASQPNQIKVNDLDGVRAATSTTQEALAAKIGLKARRLRKLNDLEKDQLIDAGRYYYMEPKRGSAEAKYHIVRPGETLWSISQMYGMKLSALKAKNRIYREEDLMPGMILNLKEHRKRGEEIKFVPASELRRMIGEGTAERTEPSGAVNSVPPIEQRNSVSPTVAPSSTAVPTAPTVPTSGRVIHTVSAGETLFRLSQRYGVAVDDIKKWNNLPDNNIKVGQKITIIKP